MILPDTENLQAAVDWAFADNATAQQRILAIQVHAAMPHHWRTIGHLDIARAQLKTLLEAEDDLPSELRGRAMHAAGYMALWQSDPAQAQMYLDETIRLLNSDPHAYFRDWALAMATVELGEVASLQNNYALALARYTEGHARFVQVGHKWGISEALVGMARNWVGDGTGKQSLAQQRALLEQSVVLKRELNDTQGLASTLSWLSVITQQMGDLTTTRATPRREPGASASTGRQVQYGYDAEPHGRAEAASKATMTKRCAFMRKAWQLLQQMGMSNGLAAAQHNMGHICLIQGDVPRATAYFKDSLVLYQRLENKEGIALALAGLGGVAAAIQRAGLAVIYLISAERLLKSINYYFESTDRMDYERNLAAARAQLSEADYEAAVMQAHEADFVQLAQEAIKL